MHDYRLRFILHVLRVLVHNISESQNKTQKYNGNQTYLAKGITIDLLWDPFIIKATTAE